MTEAAIDISGVSKTYGSGADAVSALRDIHFAIEHNEFFTLLGPSGCGKTTLLRIIGGFESFNSGEIKLYGEAIKDLPANKRSVNTVFQNYALFPHISIRDNVGFGLKMLGKSAAEIRKRADEMLEMVKLSEYAERKPAQLSGGQQQRVALARALAPAPKVLLLDEPLSALDLKLRQSMRYELKQIREALGITFIFVTHDQEEALTMSDRIAVMSHGELQQIGTPEQIYNAPHNVFVADFIGETNLLSAKIDRINGLKAQCSFANNQSLSCNLETGHSASIADQVTLSIRPERIKVVDRSESESQTLQVVLQEKIFLGTDVQLILQLADSSQLIARMQSSAESLSSWQKGDSLSLIIDESAVQVLLS